MNFPPLLPSGAWYAMYVKALLNGLPDMRALEIANNSLHSSKAFGRFCLKDKKREYIFLSIAVEGGGRQLRNPDALERLKLSDHGDWRKNHLGAIEACLGKKPFYRHLQPALTAIYLNHRLESLKDFNTAIFCLVNSFLMENIRPSGMAEALSDIILIERGKEIAEHIDPDVSVLQSVSEYGRETLLGMIAGLGNSDGLER